MTNYKSFLAGGLIAFCSQLTHANSVGESGSLKADCTFTSVDPDTAGFALRVTAHHSVISGANSRPKFQAEIFGPQDQEPTAGRKVLLLDLVNSVASAGARGILFEYQDPTDPTGFQLRIYDDHVDAKHFQAELLNAALSNGLKIKNAELSCEISNPQERVIQNLMTSIVDTEHPAQLFGTWGFESRDPRRNRPEFSSAITFQDGRCGRTFTQIPVSFFEACTWRAPDINTLVITYCSEMANIDQLDNANYHCYGSSSELVYRRVQDASATPTFIARLSVREDPTKPGDHRVDIVETLKWKSPSMDTCPFQQSAESCH